MLSYDILEQLYRMEWDIGYIITGCELGQEESLWLMKDIMDVEFDKNQQSLRFWLYFMESQINKGVLSLDSYLYHEILAFMKIDNLDMPKHLYTIRTAHHIS